MAPSTTIRRLLKEVAELSPSSANPNPAFYAAPVSDSDLHEWHFTLLGPPAPSPYAGGLYHGRISLPSQYPLKPPNFRFLTPSGRFEVNREICLSISGFHEETWMPAWGLRTALTALRSFMAEAGTAGQVGGLESSDAVKQRLATESRHWRCNECGKTNTDIMEEWWTMCRDKDVNVDEDIGLEALPDGMSVEAFDKSKGKGKAKETQSSEALQQTSLPSPTSPDISSPTKSETDIKTESIPRTETQSMQSTQPTQSTQPSPTRTQPAQTPVLASPALHQSATQAQTQTSTRIHEHQNQTQNQTQGVTLDRAITVIFLALCIMILKKIFYSSSSSGYGADEWDIGLSREY